MNQLLNVIRVSEGGVSVPYIVYERVSQFASPQIPKDCKLIREQRNGEASFLICKSIPDATFEDILSDNQKESQNEPSKGSHVDVKV